MTPSLSESERDELRLSFTTAGFSMEDAMRKVMQSGYSPEEAKLLILAEYKAYKKELFDQAIKRNESSEMRNVMFVLVTIISIIGPVVRISSVVWYLVAIVLCGIGGYIAYKDKPVAGVLGGVVVPIAFLISYDYYFSGRTSYIKIEMAIPLIMAYLPAVIIFLLISKLFYTHNSNDY